MYDNSEHRSLQIAWLWTIGFTVFRLIYSGTFLLIPDETNYWQWSRYLDWGYHDQAPLIGWAIWLSTWIIGQTELAVRLPSVLSVGIASAYLVAISSRWMGSRTALSTAILTQSILEFNVGGLLATPDGLQAAAWAGAAYHVARAYEDDALSQWLLGRHLVWTGDARQVHHGGLFAGGFFIWPVFPDSQTAPGKPSALCRSSCGMPDVFSGYSLECAA